MRKPLSKGISLPALPRVWAVLSFLFVLVPPVSTASLALFSRPIYDDYLHIAAGKALGAYNSVDYWRNRVYGSFADTFTYGLLAPLDEAAPAFMALTTIALWIAAATALWAQALALAKLRTPRALAFALSAIMVSATIAAVEYEAFYWYSANVRYALPTALITALLAGVLWLQNREGAKKPKLAALIAITAYCFITAGFSEMFALFQLAGLALALGGAHILFGRGEGQNTKLCLALGSVAACVCLAFELSALGAQNRLDTLPTLHYTTPIRALPELLTSSLNTTLELLGSPAVFRGFILLMFAGLCCSAALVRPTHTASRPSSFTLKLPPLCFALVAQLLFAAGLWSHRSDDAQIFGWFSYAYFAVILLNVFLSISLVGLILMFRKWNSWHSRQECATLHLSVIVLLVIIALFSITQIRDAHYKAVSYLFLSVLSLLIAYSWCFVSQTEKLLVLFARAITIVSLGLLFVLVSAALYVQGYTVERALIPALSVLVAAAAVWGISFGVQLRHHAGYNKARFYAAFFALAFCTGLLLVSSQVQMMPNLSSFAKQWDARHLQILDAKAHSHAEVEVPRMRYRLAKRRSWNQPTSLTKPAVYYGAETIDCNNGTCLVVFAQSA